MGVWRLRPVARRPHSGLFCKTSRSPGCRATPAAVVSVLFVPNTGAEKHKLRPTQHDPLAASMAFGPESVIVLVAREGP